MSDTLRGAILMVIAMAAFSVEDTILKLVSQNLPVGQILILLALGGAPIFALMAKAQGHRLNSPALRDPYMLLRNVFEMIGTVGIVMALSLIPLTTASAVIQVVPLAVVMGAAVWLKEPVGWRRWSAVVLGFAGVLIILRPGLDGFDANTLWAVMGVCGLTGRDLATRRIPGQVPSSLIACTAFASILPAGLLLMVLSGTAFVTATATDLWHMALALLVGVLAYLAIIAATRSGDMAMIAPVRYTRILFALIIGFFVFDERPDAAMLAGSALIIGSGCYAFLREARLQRAASLNRRKRL